MTCYASYRARLGLTIATFAAAVRPDLATELLSRVADEATKSDDGYAARPMPNFSIGKRPPRAVRSDLGERAICHRSFRPARSMLSPSSTTHMLAPGTDALAGNITSTRVANASDELLTSSSIALLGLEYKPAENNSIIR